jgi:hypothetical protein
VHLSARPNQRFPRIGIELTSEKNLNLTAEMLQACGSRRKLRMNAGAPTEESRGNDARIVEYEEFIAAKKIWKLDEEPILKRAGRAIQQEKPRSFATVQGSLRNPIRRQTIVELVQSHEMWSLAAILITTRKERRKLQFCRLGERIGKKW